MILLERRNIRWRTSGIIRLHRYSARMVSIWFSHLPAISILRTAGWNGTMSIIICMEFILLCSRKIPRHLLYRKMPEWRTTVRVRPRRLLKRLPERKTRNRKQLLRHSSSLIRKVSPTVSSSFHCRLLIILISIQTERKYITGAMAERSFLILKVRKKKRLPMVLWWRLLRVVKRLCSTRTTSFM